MKRETSHTDCSYEAFAKEQPVRSMSPWVARQRQYQVAVSATRLSRYVLNEHVRFLESILIPREDVLNGERVVNEQLLCLKKAVSFSPPAKVAIRLSVP